MFFNNLCILVLNIYMESIDKSCICLGTFTYSYAISYISDPTTLYIHEIHKSIFFYKSLGTTYSEHILYMRLLNYIYMRFIDKPLVVDQI